MKKTYFNACTAIPFQILIHVKMSDVRPSSPVFGRMHNRSSIGSQNSHRRTQRTIRQRRKPRPVVTTNTHPQLGRTTSQSPSRKVLNVTKIANSVTSEKPVSNEQPKYFDSDIDKLNLRPSSRIAQHTEKGKKQRVSATSHVFLGTGFNYTTSSTTEPSVHLSNSHKFGSSTRRYTRPNNQYQAITKSSQKSQRRQSRYAFCRNTRPVAICGSNGHHDTCNQQGLLPSKTPSKSASVATDLSDNQLIPNLSRSNVNFAQKPTNPIEVIPFMEDAENIGPFDDDDDDELPEVQITTANRGNSINENNKTTNLVWNNIPIHYKFDHIQNLPEPEKDKTAEETISFKHCSNQKSSSSVSSTISNDRLHETVNERTTSSVNGLEDTSTIKRATTSPPVSKINISKHQEKSVINHSADILNEASESFLNGDANDEHNSTTVQRSTMEDDLDVVHEVEGLVNSIKVSQTFQSTAMSTQSYSPSMFQTEDQSQLDVDKKNTHAHFQQSMRHDSSCERDQSYMNNEALSRIKLVTETQRMSPSGQDEVDPALELFSPTQNKGSITTAVYDIEYAHTLLSGETELCSPTSSGGRTISFEDDNDDSHNAAMSSTPPLFFEHPPKELCHNSTCPLIVQAHLWHPFTVDEVTTV